MQGINAYNNFRPNAWNAGGYSLDNFMTDENTITRYQDPPCFYQPIDQPPEPSNKPDFDYMNDAIGTIRAKLQAQYKKADGSNKDVYFIFGHSYSFLYFDYLSQLPLTANGKRIYRIDINADKGNFGVNMKNNNNQTGNYQASDSPWLIK